MTNKIKFILSYIKKPQLIFNKLFEVFNIKNRYTYLIGIVLYVNSICNLKCIMCDVGQAKGKGIDTLRLSQKKTNLDLNLLRKLLNDPYIRKRKIFFNILMTEPLLHPQICEIIKLIKKEGHNVKLTTNGFLLPKKAKEIVSTNIDSIQVSIDGPEKIHDKIRGLKGVYKNAINGIKILNKNKKIKITINYTISCINQSEILNFLNAIENEDIKVDLVKLQYMDFVSKEMMDEQNKRFKIKQTESCISDIIHPNKINNKTLSEQLNQIKKKYRNIKQIRLIPNIKNQKSISKYFNTRGGKIKRNSKCFYPWHQLAFTTDGKICIHIRCFNYCYGDFKKNNIKEIFYNKSIKSFRKKLKKNGFCFPACTRCCGVMR